MSALIQFCSLGIFDAWLHTTQKSFISNQEDKPATKILQVLLFKAAVRSFSWD